MAMGKKRWRQEPMWIANQELPRSRGHVFYDRVNEILKSEKFSYVHTGEVWLLVSLDTTVSFRTVTATHPPTTPRLTVEERAEDCGVLRSTEEYCDQGFAGIGQYCGLLPFATWVL